MSKSNYNFPLNNSDGPATKGRGSPQRWAPLAQFSCFFGSIANREGGVVMVFHISRHFCGAQKALTGRAVFLLYAPRGGPLCQPCFATHSLKTALRNASKNPIAQIEKVFTFYSF